MEPNQLILTGVACDISNQVGLTSGEKKTWANNITKALLHDWDRLRLHG